MVVDSTILVDLFKGSEAAERFLLQSDELIVSRVSVMEIVAGARNTDEKRRMLRQLDALHIQIAEISESISILAGTIFNDFFHHKGIGAMDSFIAATALYLQKPLATHNKKHFQFISGLSLIVPY